MSQGGAAQPAGRQNTVQTVVVMLCTAASRLFGYVRQALFNYYFGGAGAADAINAVFNIPNNLRKLFAEGAFSSAFIPVLSTTLADDPTGLRPRELVRTLVMQIGGTVTATTDRGAHVRIAFPMPVPREERPS